MIHGQSRGVVFASAIAAVAVFTILLASPAWAFDLDSAIRACQQYKLPEQATQHLQCLNNCVEGLKHYTISQQAVHGKEAVDCGVRCIENYQTKINACFGHAESAEDCVNSVTDEAHFCLAGCGFAE